MEQFLDKYFPSVLEPSRLHSIGMHINKESTELQKFVDKDFVNELNKLLPAESHAKSLVLAAKAYGITAAQLFVINPKTYDTAVNLDYDLIKLIAKRLNIRLVVHASYLLLLPSKNIIKQIKQHLYLANRLNAEGLVIHIAKNYSADEIAKCCVNLESELIDINNGVTIYLEPIGCACRKDEYWLDSSDLLRLATAFENHKVNRRLFQLMIDTSHVAMCPDSKIDTYSDAKQYLDVLPINEWFQSCGHFQGNLNRATWNPKTKKWTGRDLHCVPFHEGDQLWKGDYSESGLRRFIEVFHNRPIIFERFADTADKCVDFKHLFETIHSMH